MHLYLIRAGGLGVVDCHLSRYSLNNPQLSIRDQTEPLWLLGSQYRAGLGGYCTDYDSLTDWTVDISQHKEGELILMTADLLNYESYTVLLHLILPINGRISAWLWLGDKRDVEREDCCNRVIPHYQCSGRCSHNRHQERAGAGLTCRVTFLPPPRYNPPDSLD